MKRMDDINAQLANFEARRSRTMLADRANVLAKMSADIWLFRIKTLALNGALVTFGKLGGKTSSKNVH